MTKFGRSKITDISQRQSEGFHPHRRSLLALGGGALLAAAGMQAANAQDYPARPIQVLVPFAGGSASDVITVSFSTACPCHLDRPSWSTIVPALAAISAPLPRRMPHLMATPC
ncbi:hypothetical protein BDHH15_37080 [Bradyrhizobium diazoefficiens]|uniref:Uncharacterized protein n=1 Tax=Bradyrhizobium diazoefficiens TaxID=1355477 RepID=A0A810C463_9BRAD|nr:hypothetical protein H12S4_40340 [Bradyrhizobium diazoefficiens]BCA20493.1 hypothetical protein BDHH15_37080 [Bradyrhizobium diazoefficiens]BCE29920.1 hypothetical protein XF2B_36890 [Bradyrhizobium diazoefficiens]BCE38663.1 hypothetical protein XF3B_36940 [Bradyrhizobium diazoefficiens]BCE82260.1 hypothetical protein XF9B_36810 [Bradyrhizobium diazoefficiens]